MKKSGRFSVFGAGALAITLLLGGCGGGGGTESGGGSGGGSSNTVVRGNVSSVGDGIGALDNAAMDSSVIAILEKLVAASYAGDIQGIEVCIQGVCATTDASGAFILDLVGVAGGVYPITFSTGGSSYTAEVEIMDDALVVLENVTISDDGVVRINSVRVVLTDEPDDEPPVIIVDDDGQDDPAPQKVLVCHKPGTPAEKQLVLPESALKGHLGHGDVEGNCPSENVVSDDDDDDLEPS